MVQDSEEVIRDLCSQFDQKLQAPVLPAKHNSALDMIFGQENPLVQETQKKEELETVITRAYQDHSETRKHLGDLVKKDPNFAVTLFGSLGNKSVHVLIGVHKNVEETKPLLGELKHRIHCGEDQNSHFLLSCILQLLHKFTYKFDDLKWLVTDICLRMMEPDIRAMGLVIFSQLDEKFHNEFETQLLNFIDELVIEAEADVGNDPLAIIVAILRELYPAFTALCSSVMLGKDLDKLLQSKATVQEPDQDFVISLLKLLAIACIDENVRVHISENYMHVLELSYGVPEYKIYSSLVLIKTWSFTKLKDISIHQLTVSLIENFLKESRKGNSDELPYAIEGLAYISLKTFCKFLLRHHNFFCPELVNMMKEGRVEGHNLYGLMVIMANLGTLPDDSSSKEPKSLRDLKAYSDLKSPNLQEGDEGMKDDKMAVVRFNQQNILETNIISDLKTKLPDLTQGARQQFIRIIYNLTRERKSIVKVVEQGATTVVLECLMNQTGKESGDISRVLAYRSLTRILIYTDPSLIFNKYSPMNALQFLFDLLPIIDAGVEEDNVFFKEGILTTADQYESLLALTNLASFSGSAGEDICKAICSNGVYWSKIENLMLDENVVLQRSDLELICNLMSHPMAIAVKFFNFDNPQSFKNFTVLVKLLLLDDIKSQRAVAAIFANIANTIPFVAKDLLKQEELIKNCATVFIEQMDDEALRQRLLSLFYSLFELTPEENSVSHDDYKKVLSLEEIPKLKDALELLQKKDDIPKQDTELITIILAKLK
ncbi:She4p KNAG_0B03120 [Huiozyma naganishii CBS 8797]|uniref:UNC-45/Cro1/She4 central domain-containing protein n=1 Tax=Huiozyma naganishii (strain ATCC MYA-139 / BCRC 22969 / CBS 8797 / KCTC 17520 / NBRC 10181 / NCYC 3082 / Yp74L-3) TaxID=1071383 RepID=J7S3J0_HUIN7|nr:hypothetical protein KNAG_0B03120 [Kazachstania naganishii CBS 8797]CCK68754.1 hypothetical protein KNAG_0B03120 [Kazachstania naganishii CBS 8797]